MKIATIVLASALALSGSIAMAQTSGGTAAGATAAGGNSAAGGQGNAGKPNAAGQSTTGASVGMTNGTSQMPAVNDGSKTTNPDAAQSKQGPGPVGTNPK